MTTLLSIIGFAALFALFGALRPRRECGGSCEGCTSACSRREGRHE